ncbi:hypothetical protein [Pseudomonas protegens]|uniref:hypothetical protein n=1 Tax=Pseudomonas protegens TaxID=380021 RepID=UPI00223A8C9C|nr:hypothetical protein [Pseudomonas protegens]
MQRSMMLLAWAWVLAAPAWAEGQRLLPSSEHATGGYLSSQLLLKPCADVAALGFADDENAQRSAAEARKALPAGTCEDGALVEKLFRARFLQHAAIAMVYTPWQLDEKIARQDRAIRRCQDTQCLARELDGVIAVLSPVYLGVQRQWPRGKGLCAADPLETPSGQVLALLDSDSTQAITDTCAGDEVLALTCRGPHGKWLSVSCGMSGNQVNSSQWLFLAGKAPPKPLLAVEDGPVAVLETTCNGLPDLMTSARISAGEHDLSYYRYDGKAYRQVYAYSSEFVGSDANGNDLLIARGGTKSRVACR